MLAFSYFPIALCFLMSSTAAQDFKITCPASGFKVGERATVTCEVNKAAFKAPCILPVSYIKFFFTSPNGVKHSWCFSSYKTCGKSGSPIPGCGKCSCVCEKDNATFTRHRLDFIPTSAHAAGNISCEVECLNFGNLPPLTKNKCDRVTVAASQQRIGANKSAVPRHGIGAGRSGAVLGFILALTAVALAPSGFGFLI